VPTGTATADPSDDGKRPAAACQTCDAAKKEKAKKDKEARDRKVAKMTEGLDPKLRADVEKSPSLQNDLADLQDKGWTVREDPTMQPPQAGNSNMTTKEITLASGSDTSSLAHEVQHAENYENGVFQAPAIGNMSRDEFVTSATNASVADERSAFQNQNLVRSEILDNGGRDIGPVRSFGSLYEERYTQYYSNAYGAYYDRNKK
jgi:hypothetical protein